MKIPNLKKQIIRNFFVAGVMFIVFGIGFYYYSNQQKFVKDKIDKINNEAAQFSVELADLQSKTAEIKKYKDMWPKISQSKKDVEGIKIDEVNKILNSIAKKYSIGSPNIKLSLPELMNGGVFDRKTINVMMTTANVTFTATTDVKAIMFADEFIRSLKGYPVVTLFNVSKNKEYSNDDLIEISMGKAQGNIGGKFDFYWYIYKEKGNENKTEEKTKTSTPDSQPKSGGEVEQVN